MAEGCVNFEEVKPANKKTLRVRVPAGRSGHCCASDDANLYVYGGYNPKKGPPFAEKHGVLPAIPSPLKRQVMTEVWRFNFATQIWSKINRKCPNKHVTGASACCVMLPDRLFVYGGTTVPWGGKNSNTLSIFNVTTGLWQKVPVTSASEDDMPKEAYGQSLVLHQGCAYVFTGALSPGDEPISELHRLELKTGTWKKLSTQGSPPEGRYKQSMVVFKDRYLLVLGGGGHLESRPLDVLHVYDLEVDQWEEWKCGEDLGRGFPRSRVSFACELIDNRLFVFGGRHYSKALAEWMLNSCWELDMQTLCWKQMQLSLPMEVSFLTSCVMPAGYVYLFGGTIRDGARTNKIHRVRLFLPKLKELCWDVVISQIKDLSKKHIPALEFLGIPSNFVQRLQ